MNKIQKKRLYESIMRSVSKTVKKKLNEADDSFETNVNNVYNILISFFNTVEKNAKIFQANRMVKTIGFDNIANLKYGCTVQTNETEPSFDIPSFNQSYNESPDSFENLDGLSVFISIPTSSDFAEIDYPNIDKDTRGFFLRNLPDICKEIANRYGLRYANSGYHIELTRKNFLDITDIDDLKQACEDVISIQKILYKKSINFMYNNMDQMDF